MFDPQAYYTYRTASCQFDCNANEYWWWSTAAMTGLLKNRLRWDAIFEEHFWSSRLRWFSPGRRWRMSSSTTFPRCSKPRTPRCTLWSRWVYIKYTSSFRVSRFLALLDTQREKCRPNDRENLTTISTIGHDERVQTAHQTTEWKIHWQDDLRLRAKCDLIVLFLNQLQQNVIWWICWNHQKEN